MGKGGDDSMWLLSVAMFPIGLTLFSLAFTIGPGMGMTPSIRMFLVIFGTLSMFLSIAINLTLRYFFPIDVDDLRVEVKRTMRERKRIRRRYEKQRNLKSAMQISIPGFEDVKIRPHIDDISDSDEEGSDDGEHDPESRW